MQRFLVDIAPVSHDQRRLLHAGHRWIQPPPSLGGQPALLDPLTAAGWVRSSPPPMDLLTPGTVPPPRRAPAPSVLLNARHTVVPWHEAGRAEILADLDAWADDPSRAVTARLLHAEGGIGKTRLAIEWVRRRRGRHDVAGFLEPAPGDAWLERLCGLGPPVLVVIDYAETRADLVPVLERVARFGAATGPRRRVRVLLLARSDGAWTGKRRQRRAMRRRRAPRSMRAR